MLRSTSLFCVAVAILSLAAFGAGVDAAADDLRDIQKVVETYERGWSTLSPGALAGMWDQGHKPIVYLAAEHEAPLLGWESVRDYYEAGPAALSEVTMQVLLEGLSIDILGDVAYAFFPFHFSATLKEGGRSIEANGHVTMVLHKRDGKWRVVHYHESSPLRIAGQQ